MVGEETGGFQERLSGTWRGAMASAGAVLATLLLFGLLFMVNQSNATRDTALESERHSYDVMLLTRTVDGSVARAEAALGRYVTDEVQTTGTLYYNEWLLAAQQIRGLERLVHDNPQQYRRVVEAKQLFDQRAHELGAAAAAARTKKGQGGLPLFFQAGKTPTGNALSNKLAEIGAAERSDLITRMATTRRSSDLADQLTRWFGLLAALIGVGAIGLGIAAFRAMAERLQALRDADSEASRAALLETAVAERTCELGSAKEQLMAEAAERAAAEAQLRQVQKMEAVGQLTGGIAHDFNNLLTGVLGSIDLLQKRLAQGRMSEVDRYAATAESAAKRAAALTHRLLAFSRRQPLDPKAVDANRLVASMEELLRRTLGEAVELEVVRTAGLWTTLCDPHQLESAILNLAINGRDAMPDGGKLTIETCNAYLDDAYTAREGAVKAGQYVCVCVTDTGVGMSTDVIAKAFEPFFTTKPIGQGTGLGLSMIYGFAQQSNGYAKIYSEPGQGTTVKLYLPRHFGAADPLDQIHPLAAGRPANADGRTVLVVEDEPSVRNLVIDVLHERGYATLEAADGQIGLQILQGQAKVDLLISDVGLPGLNGRQLADAARALRPDLPILFMTGYAGNAAIAGGFLEPGMEMITKPFAIDVFVGRVASILKEDEPD
jgi:signal transduction histidine kinase/ActR/RegA family two-component response regulator